jgi:hypothetical protein
MSYPELRQVAELRDRWVAIDPRGGAGIAPLRSGGVVVDCDAELDELCARLDDEQRTSLTIFYCGDRPSA